MLLFASLSSEHIMNWFAVNIPMDIGTCGSFDGEIDIIARLRGIPGNPLAKGNFYRTWEVKVSLICKDGTTKSMKAGKGKVRAVVNQLKAYRNFGAPEVSLLDVYLCEAGDSMRYLSNILKSLSAKLHQLKENGFGYHVLPFGYGKRDNHDYGLRFIPAPPQLSLHPNHFMQLPVIAFLRAPVTDSRPPFSNLAERIDGFVEEQKDKRAYKGVFKHTVMFCRQCRKLQLILIREEYTCPNCGDNLIAQT
jgi:hypothetical protein